MAIDYTRSSWKAIFNFGKNDTRTTEGGDIGAISAATSWVKLSNPTYAKLKADSIYSKITADRPLPDPLNDPPNDANLPVYNADGQRLPIRLLNYLNATVNAGDDDMFGIANANLTALGTSYANTNYMFLVGNVFIKSPWDQYVFEDRGKRKQYLQNFTAAGLLAYATNTKLTYDGRQKVLDNLSPKFDNGDSSFLGLNDTGGFNPSLTLWALTVSNGGETPLQSKIVGPDPPPLTATHDFNGDGSSEIAWRDTSGNVVIWLMNVTSGNTQVLSAADYGIINNSWQIVGQRDFNGDGKADLLWSNTNGDTAIWLMNGSAVASTPDLGIVGNGWSIVGTGDFNGDGFGDILWRNTNGDTSVWLMTGTPTTVSVLSATDLGVVPTSWHIVGTGDFNGNGKSDILWHNDNGDTSIWLMTTTGTQVQVASTADLGVVPTSWSVALTGDFNGNGMSDILWRNSNGDTSIWFMNGTTVSSVSGLGVVPTSWVAQGAGAD
jgi:FG-GAP-like repeat